MAAGEGDSSTNLEGKLKEALGGRFNVPADVQGELAKFIANLVTETGRTAADVAAEEQRRKDEEKRKRREERRKAAAGTPIEQLSPRDREKQLRRQSRDELKQQRETERLKEEKRKQMPMIDLNQAGGVEPTSYYLFKSELQQVIKANFKLHQKWSMTDDGLRRTEEEKMHVIEQVRDRFQNGARIPTAYIVERIHKSLSDKRNHQRTKIRKYLAGEDTHALGPEEIKEKGCPSIGGINQECWNHWIDEEIQMKYWQKQRDAYAHLTLLKASLTQAPAADIQLAEKKYQSYTTLLQKLGEPPVELRKGVERAEGRNGIATHKLGQGGQYRLHAEFMSRNKRKATPQEVEEGCKHGSRHVYRRLEEELAEDGGEESSEDEDGGQEGGDSASVHRTDGGSTSAVPDSLEGEEEEEEEEMEQRPKRTQRRGASVGGGRSKSARKTRRGSR